MTPFEQFLQNLTSFDWRIIPKTGILFIIVIFILFGLLVLRQIQLMDRVVSGMSSFGLKVLAWLGLGLSVLVFLLALVIL